MIQNRRSNTLQKTFIHTVFILLSLCCVVPVLFIFSASFTSEEALAHYGYRLIPKVFSLEAYEYVFAQPKQILTAYGLTISVTAIGTLLSLFCTGTLAYVMSRKDFPLHRQISFLVFFVMLFNGGMVPAYVTITRLYNLRDTMWSMILPSVIIPWHVFLMKGFFNDSTMGLVEAAKVDGCSERRAFFEIVVPITKPGFATVGLFTAFTYWNDWWLSMMYNNKNSLTSLQYYLYRIMNNIQYLTTNTQAARLIDTSSIPGETARMALCVLAAGPMLIIFPFFQKYFAKGLTVGAIKG